MAKHIFVTGGVLSSLGKGVTSSSIGMILERMGYKIAMQKFDPYINVDPGTMNPYQHGEVYVTDDGLETDLDLGHYERFTNARVTRHSNYTAGRIYNEVIQRERRGEYLGETVQVIPHIVNEIKDAVRRLDEPGVDVAITEVGGTVGDIESLPFLEAIRQFGIEHGRQNVLFVHISYVPKLHATQEIKTKPTQHSVGELRKIGIIPDILIVRCESSLPSEARKKLSLFCNVDRESVIEERDIEYSIYEIPVMLIEQGLEKLLCKKLGLTHRPPEISDLRNILATIKQPQHEIRIGVVGKYLDLTDAYKSVWEAIAHGGISNSARITLNKISAEVVEKEGAEKFLNECDGLLVPGGFGSRGVEGKIAAIKFAREKRMPFFGLCLGMQLCVVEFARNVCRLDGAHSTEFNPETKFPVIRLMGSQEQISSKGGTMRLGSYECHLRQDSKTAQIYGSSIIFERHRHRYEFNNSFRKMLEDNGLIVAGVNPQQDLVEVVELRDHPFFIGVQYHPEFKSKPFKPHPLFASFVKSCIEYKQQKKTD